MPGRDDFELFVAARSAALLRTAYLLTGHHQDAEDLVQTSLVKAVPAWRRITGDPEPYVRRIMVRENISRWRRRRWRDLTERETAELLGVSIGTVKSQARDALARLRTILPEEQTVPIADGAAWDGQ